MINIINSYSSFIDRLHVLHALFKMISYEEARVSDYRKLHPTTILKQQDSTGKRLRFQAAPWKTAVCLSLNILERDQTFCGSHDMLKTTSGSYAPHFGCYNLRFDVIIKILHKNSPVRCHIFGLAAERPTGRTRTAARESSIMGFTFVHGEAWRSNSTKVPLHHSVSYFNLGGLEVCLGELSPPKPPVVTRLGRTGFFWEQAMCQVFLCKYQQLGYWRPIYFLLRVAAAEQKKKIRLTVLRWIHERRKEFFPGGDKNDEPSFFPLETKKTTFFCWNCNTKM